MIVISSGTGSNRGEHQLFGALAASAGGTGDPDIVTGAAGLVPIDTLLKVLNRHINVAPGAGASVMYRGKSNGITPAPLFGTRTISDTAVDDSFDAEVTASAIVTTNTTTIQNSFVWLNEWKSTAPAPAASTEKYAFQYEVDGFPGITWFHFGADFPSNSFGATECYAPLTGVTMFVGSNNTRSEMQARFATGGLVKYSCIAWANLASGSTIEVALEANATIGSGGDVYPSTPWTLVGADASWQAIVDTTSTFTVTAGDFLNYRCVRTVGADTAANIIICLGFAAA